MSLVPIEAEKAVLGAALAGEWHEDCEALLPQDFGEPRNVLAWAAVTWLRAKGQVVQTLSVAERLRSRGELDSVGGYQYLQECDVNGSIWALGLPQYVRLVRDRAERRAIVAANQASTAKAHDVNLEPSRIALESANVLAELGEAGESTDFTFRDALLDFADRMDKVQSGNWHQYQPTYVRMFDKIFAGLERGRLTIIGAFPSVGKSALEATILLERAARGHKDGLFTLEDPKIWLSKRYVARATGIPVRRLMESPKVAGHLNEHQHARIAEAYNRANDWCDALRIDERAGLSSHQIVTKGRQWIRRHGVETVWVDNASEVDLADESGDRNDLKTGAMVRNLRNLAKAMDIPVVLLVHFKKPAQSSKEPRFVRPTSDLWKNSGAFSEAARTAIALWQNEELPGGIVATALKQTEGRKDVDVWMKMDEHAGLVNPSDGFVVGEEKGYDEAPTSRQQR